MFLNGLNFKVKRTKRIKTISIKIKEQIVFISIPFFLSNWELKKIIKEKEEWIRKKILYQKFQPKLPKKKFVTGEFFLIKGKKYKLVLQGGNEKFTYLTKKEIIICVGKKIIEPKLILEKWYRTNSLIHFKKRSLKYEKIIGVAPKSIKSRNYSSRWGSCSSKGDITFNWRLFMAPYNVIDYVIVHELCHLLEANHSKDFWNKVKLYFPNFNIYSNWLKHNGHTLHW